MTNDPRIYSEHVTITTRNGVVRLEGIVIPGARRVADALETMHNDADGG